MTDEEYPFRSVTIRPPVAEATARAPAPVLGAGTGSGTFVLFDPDAPKVDPEELLKQYAGEFKDPNVVQHNCPFCHMTLPWEVFKAHAVDCITRWASLYRKTFPGIDPVERNE